jgi:hypothetical protein
MMRLSVVLLGISISLFLVGCRGTDGGTALITPLPPSTLADTTPTLTPNAEPTTTRLEATVTALAITTATPQPTIDNSHLSSFALVSPTPSENNLAPGEAREIARATDIVLQPTFQEGSERLTFDSFPVPLTFSEFYTGFSMRHGLLFTDKLKSLDGQQVVIEGYVAPPLKPKLDFFVLTRVQLAFCPFCSSDAEWPDDIVLVYLPEQEVLSTEFPVRLTGQLELGTSIDAETGMVSLVRIYAEHIETLR